MKEFFNVGKIANTHGLKGEVKIYPYTETKERYEDYDELLVGNQKKVMKIEQIRYHKNMVIAKLEGLDHINDAERLKDEELYVRRDELDELEDGAFYVEDMIGLSVVDEKEGQIGTLKDVLQYTAQDVYVVKRKGAADVLIPAVKAFVKSVDMEAKEIHVKLIEGMLE